MPLEISEIGVHMAVGQGAGPSGGASAAQSQPQQRQDDDAPQALSTEQIVELCVREVLRVLDRRQER